MPPFKTHLFRMARTSVLAKQGVTVQVLEKLDDGIVMLLDLISTSTCSSSLDPERFGGSS